MVVVPRFAVEFSVSVVSAFFPFEFFIRGLSSMLKSSFAIRWFSGLFLAASKAESYPDLCLQDAVRLSRKSEKNDPCDDQQSRQAKAPLCTEHAAKLKGETSAQHVLPRPLTNAGRDLGMET
jgi:hypothetical protein